MTSNWMVIAMCLLSLGIGASEAIWPYCFRNFLQSYRRFYYPPNTPVYTPPPYAPYSPLYEPRYTRQYTSPYTPPYTPIYTPHNTATYIPPYTPAQTQPQRQPQPRPQLQPNPYPAPEPDPGNGPLYEPRYTPQYTSPYTPPYTPIYTPHNTATYIPPYTPAQTQPQRQPQPRPQLQPNPYPAPEPDPGNGKICGINKKCVSRVLCNNGGTVNADDVYLCKYSEVCCYTGDRPTEPKESIKPVDPHKACGYRNPEGVGLRFTGKREGGAKFGEFPWMVAIFYNDSITGETVTKFRCGGAVIAPNVVLTAAQCMLDLKPHELMTRAGEWDVQTKLELLAHQDASVKEIIRHESYNKEEKINDVALLILETPFVFGKTVRPICLPEANGNFDSARCYATGWGIEKIMDYDQSQTILKKIELPVVPRDTCQANLQTVLGKDFNLDRSFICAGGEKDKGDCYGDAGSPLVCPDPQNPQRYYQAGIVALGVGCGEENIPGMYSNVPYLRNWINQKLSARGIDFKYFTA